MLLSVNIKLRVVIIVPLSSQLLLLRLIWDLLLFILGLMLLFILGLMLLFESLNLEVPVLK